MSFTHHKSHTWAWIMRITLPAPTNCDETLPQRHKILRPTTTGGGETPWQRTPIYFKKHNSRHLKDTLSHTFLSKSTKKENNSFLISPIICTKRSHASKVNHIVNFERVSTQLLLSTTNHSLFRLAQNNTKNNTNNTHYINKSLCYYRSTAMPSKRGLLAAIWPTV
jgi:hypothetical protein